MYKCKDGTSKLNVISKADHRPCFLLSSQECFGVHQIESWFTLNVRLAHFSALRALMSLRNVTVTYCSYYWKMSLAKTTDAEKGKTSAGSIKRLYAFQQFGRCEGEVTKLLLVDGRDQRVINWCEGGLFLSKIWVEVVDILCCFLDRDNKALFSSSNISARSSQSHKVRHCCWRSLLLSFINTLSGHLSDLQSWAWRVAPILYDLTSPNRCQ